MTTPSRRVRVLAETSEVLRQALQANPDELYWRPENLTEARQGK
jgi:hypothetical protein